MICVRSGQEPVAEDPNYRSHEEAALKSPIRPIDQTPSWSNSLLAELLLAGLPCGQPRWL